MTRVDTINYKEDVYGHEVWDYFTNPELAGLETIERSDGLIDLSKAAPELYFATIANGMKLKENQSSLQKEEFSMLDVGPGAFPFIFRRKRILTFWA